MIPQTLIIAFHPFRKAAGLNYFFFSLHPIFNFSLLVYHVWISQKEMSSPWELSPNCWGLRNETGNTSRPTGMSSAANQVNSKQCSVLMHESTANFYWSEVNYPLCRLVSLSALLYIFYGWLIYWPSLYLLVLFQSGNHALKSKPITLLHTGISHKITNKRLGGHLWARIIYLTLKITKE